MQEVKKTKQEQREAGAEVNKITTGSKEEDKLENETDQRADQLEATTIRLVRKESGQI